MSNNSDGHDLLSVVSAVHHERVGETLNDGALGFPESLSSISASGVRDVDRLSDLDVIAICACQLPVALSLTILLPVQSNALYMFFLSFQRGGTDLAQ